MTKSGSLILNQGKGTPQGGVISPLLANLFLHYGFDQWLKRTDNTVAFTRYADDVIVNCKSQKHAEQILEAIKNRMQQIGLELHPKKTKIVYCKDYRRKGIYPHVKFDFLGYSYQPRTSKSNRSKGIYLGYDCGISISSRKRIADKLLNNRLVRWARKRYKRYKTSINRAYKWFERVKEQYPNLFYHWQMGYVWEISILDLYNKSRMMGDYHVRFCERLGVKLPLSTRPPNVANHLRNER